MYNLYYRNNLINTKGAVGQDAVDELSKREYVFKVTEDTTGKRRRERIPVKDIKIVKTFVF